LRERREVWNGTAFVSTPVYAREQLAPGAGFAGPAIVEQYDATTYVAPGWRASVDSATNLRLVDASV
jgi:N-methylhydantoinase A